MPIELMDLLGDERWVEVVITDDVHFNVAYRPGATSLKRQAELQRLVRQMQNGSEMDEVEQAERMVEIFCEVVSNWDLVNDGEPLPVTVKVVSEQLPGLVFNAIIQAIGNDGKESQEEKKVSSATSGATSRLKDKQVNARNGTTQSARRDTWA